jgi:hypothetical protein
VITAITTFIDQVAGTSKRIVRAIERIIPA